MIHFPKLVDITNESYLCNDVLTKKMVSQVWMVNTILELLLPFEHQHINNLRYTCSWTTHPSTYIQHLGSNFLMLMIMMFIKSEDTNNSFYLDIGNFGMLLKLYSNLWIQIYQCSDFLQVVALHNSGQCSTSLFWRIP
jgi:hypothetical protein